LNFVRYGMMICIRQLETSDPGNFALSEKNGGRFGSTLRDLDLDNNCQSPGGYYGSEVCTSTGTIWQRAGF